MWKYISHTGGITAGKRESGTNRSGEPLHPRELKILGLISEWMRNREIGERLFLSGETVKWYLKRLYGKLEVSTRTEAIASARRSGILS